MTAALAPPVPGHFRWGRFDDLGGALAGEDDAAEILRDDELMQFSRIALAPGRGDGTIEYLCDDTLRVLVMNAAFRDGLHATVTDQGWIRLNFSLRITIDMALGEATTVHESEPSWRFVWLPAGAHSVEIIPPGVPVQWVTLCFTPERLAAVAGVSVDNLPFRPDGDHSDGDGLVYRSYPFTHPLYAATTELFQRRPGDALRAAHLAAKASELMVHAFDHLLNDQSVANFVGLRLTRRDAEAIEAARAILDANLADPPSISALSRRMAINRNKLFYGFKSRFGVTVSEYVANLRLQESVRLLTDSDEPLSSIAASVGFRHQCNFSTAFKKRYGVSPRSMRTRRDQR